MNTYRRVAIAGAATLGSAGTFAGAAHSIETYTNQPSAACAGELALEPQVVDVIPEACLGDLALKTWPGFEYHVSTDTHTVNAQTTETITSEYYVVPSRQDYLNGGLLDTDEDMRWPFSPIELGVVLGSAIFFGAGVDYILRDRARGQKKQSAQQTPTTLVDGYKTLTSGYSRIR
ncbi:hypothetical protein KC963_03900 [Candidatus Saccharibacteria bacterium]|nr:hypothetical protein [Candidatus Saccharibacteria bacterium]MCA9337735.1 hypothetical protein [Candidatus Saccharibacteria bacterium]